MNWIEYQEEEGETTIIKEFTEINLPWEPYELQVELFPHDYRKSKCPVQELVWWCHNLNELDHSSFLLMIKFSLFISFSMSVFDVSASSSAIQINFGSLDPRIYRLKKH